MKTRRVAIQDLDEISALMMRSKQSNGYSDDFMEACRDELTLRADQLTQGEHWAVVHETIVAYVSLQFDGCAGEAELDALFVDPEWQGQGLGRQLWQLAVTQALQLGATAIYLTADPAAVPFYQSMGLINDGRRPSGSIPGRWLPHMRLQL